MRLGRQTLKFQRIRSDMRIELCFSVAINDCPTIYANGGNTVNDDLKRLATEYKDKLKQKETETLAFTQEQKLLQNLGPKRWAELRQLIKDKVEEFNVEMGTPAISWDEIHSDRLSITRRADGVKLEGGYDETAKTVFFRSPQLAINLVLTQVVHGNDVVFVVINSKTKMEYVNDPESVAYGILRDFLSR